MSLQLYVIPRFETSDPKFCGFVQSLDMFAKNAASCQPYNICPALARIPKINTPAVRVKTGIREVKEFVRTETEGHKVKFDKDNIRDIIDAFLLEVESRRRSGRDLGSFTEREMEQVIFDLFFTGAETSSTCLRWAVFLMAVFPRVQARIHCELDAVLGPHGEVSLDKRAQLPYLDATISEVLRFRPAAPFMYRCATKDSRLRGYFIPENTQILVNLWSVHMDPKHWQNPEQFNPERFLNPEGTTKLPEAFKAFGLGKTV
ncbi:cytochrome P450 2U1-like [Branchiostoma floridae x Branchiostoma belcheri]